MLMYSVCANEQLRAIREVFMMVYLVTFWGEMANVGRTNLRAIWVSLSMLHADQPQPSYSVSWR